MLLGSILCLQAPHISSKQLCRNLDHRLGVNRSSSTHHATKHVLLINSIAMNLHRGHILHLDDREGQYHPNKHSGCFESKCKDHRDLWSLRRKLLWKSSHHLKLLLILQLDQQVYHRRLYGHDGPQHHGDGWWYIHSWLCSRYHHHRWKCLTPSCICYL